MSELTAEELASLEYEDERKIEKTSQKLVSYLESFSSLSELRNDLSSRNNELEEKVPLENIFNQGPLNCETKTTAQALYRDIHDEAENDNLIVQFDTIGRGPFKFPAGNHVLYESEEDIRPFDFKEEFENSQEYPVEAIVGIRAANLMVDNIGESDLQELYDRFSELEKHGNNDFYDSMNRAAKIDKKAAENLPEKVFKAYDAIL